MLKAEKADKAATIEEKEEEEVDDDDEEEEGEELKLSKDEEAEILFVMDLNVSMGWRRVFAQSFYFLLLLALFPPPSDFSAGVYGGERLPLGSERHVEDMDE